MTPRPGRDTRIFKRLSRLGLVLVLATLAGARPAAAGDDPCPEPNDTLATACFLGPNAPAGGFLDTPNDIDVYRVELPEDASLVARLSALPADYRLLLVLADGRVQAEAAQPGLEDRLLRVDGLAKGRYFLAVVARGEVDPSRPYLLSVRFPPPIPLGTPAIPPPAGPLPPRDTRFIPRPAARYGLQPSDLGPDFNVVSFREAEDGTEFGVAFAAPDASPSFLHPDIWISPTTTWMTFNYVFIEPYGSEAEIAEKYLSTLERYRTQHHAIIEPALGWGSQRVTSYTWFESGLVYRGILLQHLNAVTFVEILGRERETGWDRLSSLTRIVERRLWDAVQ